MNPSHTLHRDGRTEVRVVEIQQTEVENELQETSVQADSSQLIEPASVTAQNSHYNERDH